MGFTVDIDTGGTFTDGFFSDGAVTKAVKVDTTPHDLTVCFFDCLRESAQAFGYDDLGGFLKDTEIIRFSSTVGTNALIQHSGPKIGVIVTEGNEVELYSELFDSTKVTDVLVLPEMVISIAEEMDGAGNSLRKPDPAEVRAKAHLLTQAGARVVVVCLANSFYNPEHERIVKNAILEDYPKHYLGAVPILTASEITSRPGDYRRLNTAVINAYIHPVMVRYLYRAEDELRNRYYMRPLLITHASGGTARVAKTRAIDTYGSGPTAGLVGSARMAQNYGLPLVTTVDIGGTSTDVGVVMRARYEYDPRAEIEHLPVNMIRLRVDSVGGGGGSLAKLLDGGQLQVGPESAGAVPGPACYDLGNEQPTVTDADVVLGFINPDYFLGGRRKLSVAKAEAAVEKHIAQPLGIPVEEAAWRIRYQLVAQLGRELRRMLEARKVTPQESALFAFGGAGGAICCDLAKEAGFPKIFTFQYNSVFSAFGSSVMDVMHIYEHSLNLPLDASRETIKLAEPLDRLRDTALRDMRGEGYPAEQIEFGLEVELVTRDGYGTVVLELDPQAWPGDVLVTRQLLAACPEAAILQTLRLRATAPARHHEIKAIATHDANTARALKGSRAAYWGTEWLNVPVYSRELLGGGATVEGPAIIEGADTTYVVPASWRYSIDEYLNGILEGV